MAKGGEAPVRLSRSGMTARVVESSVRGPKYGKSANVKGTTLPKGGAPDRAKGKK